MFMKTICKVCHEGTGFSAVDLNGVSHMFAVAVPRRGSTFGQQADDALQMIEAMFREEGARGSVVNQTVFLSDAGQIDECRRIMRDFYGRDLPATTYIPQRPCNGSMLSIEAFGVGQRYGDVGIKRVSDQLVIVRHNGLDWIHCAQIVPSAQCDAVYDAATNALKQTHSLLSGVGIHFDKIIRTWFYLGGIVAHEGPTQRYKELNRARGDFYGDVSFLANHAPETHSGPAYPASTCIGAEGRGMMIGAIALATNRKDVVAAPLENPRQTSAYDYTADYSPCSPKFSRGIALSWGTCATIFISGTASIMNSETLHINDAVAQTHETLDNIEVLISKDNLRQHGLPGFGAALEGLGLVRVYIKRQEDFAKVRAVCRQRLGELPTTYTIADICRPELLVEIEGIAFSRKITTPHMKAPVAQPFVFDMELGLLGYDTPVSLE